MLAGLRKFTRDDSGNIAIIAGGVTLPLLALAGGLYELSEYNKIKNNVQSAADNAVIAAFHKASEPWPERQRRVHKYVKANLANKNQLKKIRTNLRYERRGKSGIMTLTVKTGINSIFGDISPFSAEKFAVTATAEYNQRIRRLPHLIPNDSNYDPNKGTISSNR